MTPCARLDWAAALSGDWASPSASSSVIPTDPALRPSLIKDPLLHGTPSRMLQCMPKAPGTVYPLDSSPNVARAVALARPRTQSPMLAAANGTLSISDWGRDDESRTRRPCRKFRVPATDFLDDSGD